MGIPDQFLFGVAVFELSTDVVVSLHIVQAATWQEALNKSPAVWWNTPVGMDYEAAQAMALETYRCHIAVKATTEITQ